MLARITANEPAISGVLVPPADKSISHRALLFALLAEGTSRLEHLSTAHDVGATARMIELFGASVTGGGAETRITSPGLRGLREAADVVDMENSGTGVRLGIGVATLVPGITVFTGDTSLRQRPMARVLGPLRQLEASIWGRGGDAMLPVVVRGGKLKSGTVDLRIASAQVKSALLLAGLGIDGPVHVTEPVLTRPHTEELLELAGVALEESYTADGAHRVTIRGPAQPSPLTYSIPGDPSAAAFFVVAAAVIPEANLRVDGVYLGPTRSGFLDVLGTMGAAIERGDSDLVVEGTRLSGTVVQGLAIPSLIDEIPILCVGAAFAEGTSAFRDAGELRVKESDRIEATARLLEAFGVGVETFDDGLVVHGGLRPGSLRGKRRCISARLDHRIAMAGAILGLIAGGVTDIEGIETVATSYPGFFDDLRRLGSATVEIGEFDERDRP